LGEYKRFSKLGRECNALPALGGRLDNCKKINAYDIVRSDFVGMRSRLEQSSRRTGRLWRVWRNDTLISNYSYNPNGNRIAHLTPTFADSGTYDAQDRMLRYGNAQYVYTRNGELSNKAEGTDTTRYTYDYFGNLITVIMPNGDRIDYIIDGQNRRIGKKLNGNIIKRWIYSGQLSPIAELDSAGNVIAQFVRSLMIKNGNAYQLITDHLGSVRLVIEVNTGDVAQKIDYDEFGNVLSNSNSDFQPFGYAGGLYDTQTKLTRFGARDYDSNVGRWNLVDPVRFAGGFSNFYEYCGNDPMNSIDIWGLQSLIIWTHVGKNSSSTGDFGHAWLDLINKSGDREGVGFYHAENLDPLVIYGKAYGKNFKDDTKLRNDPNAFHQWQLTQGQYEKINEYISNFQKNAPGWSLNNNCVDFVVGALDVAGIPHPTFYVGWSYPKELAKWLNNSNNVKPCP